VSIETEKLGPIPVNVLLAAPDMLEALKLAKNVLFLLSAEVKALGFKAEQVSEKVRYAILKAEGEL
jgi:hypothetical protein